MATGVGCTWSCLLDNSCKPAFQFLWIRPDTLQGSMSCIPGKLWTGQSAPSRAGTSGSSSPPLLLWGPPHWHKADPAVAKLSLLNPAAVHQLLLPDMGLLLWRPFQHGPPFSPLLGELCLHQLAGHLLLDMGLEGQPPFFTGLLSLSFLASFVFINWPATFSWTWASRACPLFFTGLLSLSFLASFVFINWPTTFSWTWASRACPLFFTGLLSLSFLAGFVFVHWPAALIGTRPARTSSFGCPALFSQALGLFFRCFLHFSASRVTAPTAPIASPRAPTALTNRHCGQL